MYQSDCHDTWSTLDLVFSTPNLLCSITKCQAMPGLRIPQANHLPICTTIDIAIPTTPAAAQFNYRAVDWPKYCSTLSNHIEAAQLSSDQPASPQELDTFIAGITTAIQRTTEKHMPKTHPSLYAKRWWTLELMKLRHIYARASRAEFHARDTDGWADAKDSA